MKEEICGGWLLGSGNICMDLCKLKIGEWVSAGISILLLTILGCSDSKDSCNMTLSRLSMTITIRKATILASQLPIADWYNVFQSELISEFVLTG